MASDRLRGTKDFVCLPASSTREEGEGRGNQGEYSGRCLGHVMDMHSRYNFNLPPQGDNPFASSPPLCSLILPYDTFFSRQLIILLDRNSSGKVGSDMTNCAQTWKTLFNGSDFDSCYKLCPAPAQFSLIASMLWMWTLLHFKGHHNRTEESQEQKKPSIPPNFETHL